MILVFAQTALAKDLKVLTYNVFALPDPFQAKSTYERMNKICSDLKASDYDVVFLQEVWMTGYRKIFKNCGFDFVLDRKSQHHLKSEGSFGSGLLILSRYPFSDFKKYVLPKPKGIAAIFKGEGIAKKSLYLAKIVVSNKDIWLANTHLVANYCENDEWINCESYEGIRRSQFELISKIFAVELKGQNVIFGGDFNMGPQKIAHDKLWDELPNLLPGFEQVSLDQWQTTFSAQNLFNQKTPGLGKIDHLYGAGEVVAKKGKLAFTTTFIDRKNKPRQTSDHYGWETIFELP
jgi:endonuclease/exonuclease/phosphatase family metal-dependent hydrolase